MVAVLLHLLTLVTAVSTQAVPIVRQEKLPESSTEAIVRFHAVGAQGELIHQTAMTQDSSDTGATKELKRRETRVSSDHLRTWRQAFEEDPAMFAGCRSIFLDVGSNRGTHVRKMFEPQKYPGCKYLNMFDKGFGAAEKRAKPFNETGICTFGFEANPLWTSTLQQLEKAYTAQGWRVKWFAPVAVGNTTGSLDFWDVNHGAYSDWGFSVHKRSPTATEVVVPQIDFSAFMEELHKNAPSGYRLMKMDIESAEFQVLPKFVTKQLLCKNVVDTITMEWHDRFLKTEASKQQAKHLESLVNSPEKCTSGPSTTVIAFDDESYLNDGKPLPGH